MNSLILNFVCAFACCACAAQAEWTQKDVQDFINSALKDKRLDVRMPSFDLKGPLLRYDLGGSNTSSVTPRTAVDVAFSEQLRATLIRHDSRNEISSKWLAPQIDKVEARIASMAEEVQQPNLTDQERTKILNDYTSEINDIYDDALERAAKALGKRDTAAMRPARIYHVDINTMPDGGEVRCITAGQWYLYRYLRDVKKRSNVAEPLWRVFVKTQNVDLAGKYIFRVRWPDGDSFEGLVLIDQDGPITFRPQVSQQRK